MKAIPAAAGSTCLLSLVALVSLAGSASATAMDQPTQGTLLIATSEGPSEQVFPLEHTAVEAQVLGFVAQVRVAQTFNNPFTDPLEAVYVFPLPQNAAVGEMSIRIGDRLVKGIIKTREEARAIYEEARREGKTTARLDQERPNIFTQYVANIEPGKKVVVEIVYDVVLAYSDGNYEFVYPMVVGPRYIPGTPDGKPPKGEGWSPDTDEVPDASRITPPVKRPGSRSGHDITLDVILDPGMEMQKLSSPTHEIVVARGLEVSPTAVRVRIAPGDRIPNKDFVLRYRLADDRPALSVLARQSARGGHFALLFEPPARAAASAVAPKEIFFVIDASGSMSGEPMSLVKRAMRYALEHLNPDDTFQIIRFSDSSSRLGAKPLANTPRNVRRALSYINGIRANGGTEMKKGIRAALRGKDRNGRLRVICFMTDGYIGNDADILGEINRLIDDDTRLFAFGVGSSVNRYLLEHMAEVGRGAVHYALLDQPPEDQVAAFYARVRSPVLTHIEIDWKGLDVSAMTPTRIPDLFAGQPIHVIGRYAKPGKARAVVRGRIGTRRVEYALPVLLPADSGDDLPAAGADVDSGAEALTRATTSAGCDALARLWARAKIRELMSRQITGAQSDARERVTQLGLDYGLVTQYTSFVAVEQRVVNENGALRTYQVPVEMPEGVSYEGVFGVGGDRDGDGIPDQEDAAPMAMRSAGGSFESIVVRRRQIAGPGSWRWSLGVGAGIGEVDEDLSGALSTFHLRLDRGLTDHFSAGAQLALLVPHIGDADDALFANMLFQLAYSGLFDGLLEITLGAGGSLPSGGGLGLAYLTALEMRLPIPAPFLVGLQLRLDGARLPEDHQDVRSVTLGLELTW